MKILDVGQFQRTESKMVSDCPSGDEGHSKTLLCRTEQTFRRIQFHLDLDIFYFDSGVNERVLDRPSASLPVLPHQ
jgi:hypothetical protein